VEKRNWFVLVYCCKLINGKKIKERARTEVEDIYIYIYDMWANAVSESRDLGFFFLSKNISKV
jgi:hypothetical protein